MDVREITDAAQWDAFVSAQPESQFLQSWMWGEFQRVVGRHVVRFGVVDGSTLRAGAQCILQNHGLGISSLSIFRGPVIDPALDVVSFTNALELLLAALEEYAKKHGATYIHLEAPFVRQSPPATFLTNRPTWIAASSNQPANSLLLNLTTSSDDLLAAMHEKTRYNIRLAERKGVTVKVSSDPSFIETFLKLLHVTSKRDGITSHPDDYYRTMAKVLCPKQFLTVHYATYDNTTLAANLVYRFGDTVTYAHGASGNEQRNLMAPQLLQWKQIVEAQSSGAHWYDFWGIAPHDADDHHPWAGITRFKLGFGGEMRSYLPAMEKKISAKYSLVQLRRKLRR